MSDTMKQQLAAFESAELTVKFPLADSLLRLWRRPDSGRFLRWVMHREIARMRMGIPSILA